MSEDSLSTLLSQYLQRPEVKNVWFNEKEIKIDGFRFVACRFDNCKLIVTSTNFELERCYIDQKTQVVYSTSLVNIIRLFNSRYDWTYQYMPYFAPTRHENGTITIKA